jgi:hypothetical protein
MTMVAAITIDAVHRFRIVADLCPCRFRRTGFDQKKSLVVPHAVGMLSNPFNHSVSDINRIEHLFTLVPPDEPYATG